jgi:membrane protein implicated in regulation of membrane protease activity
MASFNQKKATVSTTIHPYKTGRIRFQGSWWSARCEGNMTLYAGQIVQIVGRQNITLLVEPAVKAAN